jgi:cytochrome c oxidase assembly factor CtaG/putative copper export protein
VRRTIPLVTPQTPVRSGASRRRALFAYAAGSALIVLAVSLVAGVFPYEAMNIVDPGAVVRVAAPLLRWVVDAAATVCTGSLVFAAFFTRRRENGLISPTAFDALRTAGRAAVVWAVAALLLWPFDLAATVGVPVRQVLNLVGLIAATRTLPGPKAWLLTAVLAAAIAVACRRTLRWRATPVLAAVAVLATLPIIAAGHSASDNNHDLATAAIALHIPAAVIWLGTLIALMRARGLGDDRPAAMRRYARLSIGCWCVVAFSGIVDGVVLAPGTTVFTSAFGAMLLVKVALLLALGALLLRVRGKQPSPGRLLAAELAALAAAFGLSVALTDLPAPKFLVDVVTGADPLLGYDLTTPPTALRLLVDWRIEVVFAPLSVVLAVVYLIGVRRLGRPWPRGRTLAWLAGCAVLLVATSSGLGRYAPAMFSLEAADHMLIGMLVPMLLALGAPLTLAGLVAGPSDLPGLKFWVAGANGHWARRLTRPIVVTALFVGAPFVLYFTDLYDLTVRFHWAHLGMDLVFLVIGYLYAWVVVGADPAPVPAPHLMRLGLLLVAMPFDLLLSAAILASGHLLGDGAASGNLYRALELPWVSSLAGDQRLGAFLALGISEAIMFAMLVVVVVRWRPSAPDSDYQELLDVLAARSKYAEN